MGSCGGAGREHVIELDLEHASRFVIALDQSSGPGDPRVYLRAAPCASGVELGCVSHLDPVLLSQLDAGSYFLIVDTDPSSGGSGMTYVVLASAQQQ
jgi:hypothetical protein